MHLKKLVLAAIAALMLLSLVATTASALRSIEASETRITLLSTEVTFEGGGVRVICEVGITVNLDSRSISKTPGRLGMAEVKVLGQETGAERCTEGRAKVLNEVPLRFVVLYVSFTGTLPTINGLTFELVAVRFQISNGLTCLYTSNAQGFQRVNAGTLENLQGTPTSTRFPLEAQSNNRELFCPEPRSISLSGIFRSQRTVTIRLI